MSDPLPKEASARRRLCLPLELDLLLTVHLESLAADAALALNMSALEWSLVRYVSSRLSGATSTDGECSAIPLLFPMRPRLGCKLEIVPWPRLCLEPSEAAFDS